MLDDADASILDVRILFTGGGTGGHLYPAIAIAQALGDGATVSFIGTRERMEAVLVPQAGYPISFVSSRPLVRRLSFALLATVFANAFGIGQSLVLLARQRPQFVIATGGYVCFPVVVAARILRVVRILRAPIALLEPNAQPGITNRLLAPFVDEIWGSFTPSNPQLGKKFVRTGVPVRAALLALGEREAARTRLGLAPKRRTLLVLGGSQGARSINEAILELVRERAVPDGWQILLVTGTGEYERVRRALPLGASIIGVPYVAQMGDAYAAADLVLARAGASTLAELSMLGLPALLVPYPYAADDHQTANARAFALGERAVVLADAELSAQRLRDAWQSSIEPGRFAAMSAAARRSAPANPNGAILARIRLLAARMGIAQ